MKVGWYRVELPHYVCAFRIDSEGIIRESAPIMAWARGKPVSQYAAWAVKKGGTFQSLGGEQE